MMEQLANTEPIIELQLKIDEFQAQESNFNEFFLEAVDKAFSLLGNRARELIYRYLDNKCSVSKKNIPKQVELFSQVIEEIFGESARIIEINIMRNLHEKVPDFIYPGKKSSKLSFINYVEALRLFL
jgi:hypothetical protein